MALTVMKFGGSSVADENKIKHVANRIISRKNECEKIIAVVSAQGDTTDNLLELASQITSAPSPREMDVLLSTGEMISISLLSMALNSLGQKALSLTGPQAGILTDSNHQKAKIIKINAQKIKSKFNKYDILIVAGFQGLTPKGDIATLGRGGSDLTAVALAATLKADSCEIYSDVEGVFTTDPRIIKEAKKIDFLSYDEMLEMAGSGAQVLQSRSVEVAKKFNVIINARSSFSANTGTIIASEEHISKFNSKLIKERKMQKMEELLISGISFDKNQVKVTIIDLPDIPGIAAEIFGQLADIGVNVDMIVQSAAIDKKNDISFTTAKSDMKKTQNLLDKIAAGLKASKVICDEHVAKISIIGVGMKSNPGVAAKMFKILSKKGINIEMISTSEIKISCIIDESEAEKAVEELHRGFKLEKR